jgi:hypothetical protein
MPPASGRFRAVFWALIAVMTLLGTLLRVGDRSWVARSGTVAVRVIDGVPLEWEFIDLMQSARFFEGSSHWQDREGADMLGQNLIRFVPGVLVSLAGAWTGTAWSGAILATWLAWFGAAIAASRLATSSVMPGAVGAPYLAAVLTAMGPGFAAFAGNIDAHQFGYAAAPMALAALPSGVVVVGVAIFLANATLELAAPLLVMVWFHEVPRRALAMYGPPASAIRRALAWAFGCCVLFASLQVFWWATAWSVVSGLIAPHNEGLGMALAALTHGGTSDSLSPASILRVVRNTFGDGPLLLAAAGLLWLRPYGRAWTLLWIVTIAAVAAFTRPLPRIVYLAYPAVHVSAASCIAGAAQFLSRRVATRFAPPVSLLVVLAAMGVVAYAWLGDLLGDPTLIHVWWE